MGDVNDRCSEWEPDHKDSELKLDLYNFLSTNYLFQMVREPTRITGTCESLLDLVITDAPSYVSDCEVLPPLHNTTVPSFMIILTKWLNIESIFS